MNSSRGGFALFFVGLLASLVIGGAPTPFILIVDMILMIVFGMYTLPIVVSMGLDILIAPNHTLPAVFGFAFTAMTLVLALISLPLRRLLRF